MHEIFLFEKINVVIGKAYRFFFFLLMKKLLSKQSLTSKSIFNKCSSM